MPCDSLRILVVACSFLLLLLEPDCTPPVAGVSEKEEYLGWKRMGWYAAAWCVVVCRGMVWRATGWDGMGWAEVCVCVEGGGCFLLVAVDLQTRGES